LTSVIGHTKHQKFIVFPKIKVALNYFIPFNTHQEPNPLT
jgi:hypothetical protein